MVLSHPPTSPSNEKHSNLYLCIGNISRKMPVHQCCKTLVIKSAGISRVLHSRVLRKQRSFRFCKQGCMCLIKSWKDACLKQMTCNAQQQEKEREEKQSESKNHLGDKQLLHVVQYLEDLVTVCSNIVPWLSGLRREQSGSETDSESSVSSQHSVYPSVCLAVYLTVKLSLSANSSPAAECK